MNARTRYQPRDPGNYQQRAEAGGGQRDYYMPDGTKTFTPKEGDNCIRPLPPFWDKPEHYGLDVFIHYDVGPDKAAYLCVKEMHKLDVEREKKGLSRLFPKLDGRCAVCEEYARAKDTGGKDEAYVKRLRPNKRLFTWMIDRDNEKEGPMLWSMPQTVDRDICKMAFDKRHGETYNVDDPDNGFDVLFVRKGKGERTEYSAIQIARRSTPLGRDADRWLEFVEKESIPNLLTFYPYEYVLAVLEGKTPSPGAREWHDNKAAAEQPAARGGQDAPRGESRRDERREEPRASAAPTWDSLHRMSFSQLEAFSMDGRKTDPRLNLDCKTARDEADLADWICEVLKLEKPAPESQRREEPPAASGTQERLRGVREEEAARRR